MSFFTFIITLAVSSTAIGLLLIGTALIMPRTRYWSLFWSIGLIASVATAFLAAALSQVSSLIPQGHVNSLPLHGTLELSAWPSFVDTSLQGVSATAWTLLLSKALISIYIIGTCVGLLRLTYGRYLAARIARNSTQKELTDGTIIWLTPEALPCITVSPIGRPSHSRIIVSEEFFNALSETELKSVISHEKAHIKRRDDELGVLLRTLVALCWFNPLIYNLFDRWIFSAELQCDHIATHGQSHPMRRAYAQTLLKALHITADRIRQYPAASLSTQHLRNEKMRIKRIMSGPAPIFKHVGHKMILVTTAVSLTLASAIAMSATAKTEPSPAPTPAAQTHTPPVITQKNQANIFKLEGELTSSYGKAQDPFKKGAVRNHNGVDFKAPLGTPIYAPKDGVVIAATDVFNGNPKYGKVVIIQTEGGTQTMMAHLHSYVVQTGQQISKGQKIAEIGSTGKSTGPHVHIETRLNGKRVDPMSLWQFEK